MTRDEYLESNMSDIMAGIPLDQLSPESREYILREAKKSLLTAGLRGALVGTAKGLAGEPGKLIRPLPLALTAASLGTYIPAHAYYNVFPEAVRTAGEYAASRNLYKQLAEKIKEMEKSAESINYGGILGRAVANESRKGNGGVSVIIPANLDNTYTKGTFSGKLRDDDEKAQLYKAILERMQKANPDELGDVVVHLGGNRTIQDSFRKLTNRHSSAREKIRGLLHLPSNLLTTTLYNSGRPDHYDASANTVTLYSDNPAILTHELGHAIDFNQKAKPDRYKYVFTKKNDEIFNRESEANRRSSENIRKAFEDVPDVLSALQVLRLRTLPRGLYSYKEERTRRGRLTGKNEYRNKKLKDVLGEGNVDYQDIRDEHMGRSNTDLIKLIREQLLNKGN